MAGEAQSIQEGSARLESFGVDSFRVTNMAFEPWLTLPSHYHERACFAVVLEGSVEKVFTHARHISSAGSVVTMPPQERHTDRFQAGGAHMLVVEPKGDDDLAELLQPCRDVLKRVNHYRDSGLTGMAWRVYRELQDPDSVSPLAVSGLVLEMLARAARSHNGHLDTRRPPAWLGRAREYLHANFHNTFQIAELAEAVGVHRVHLARTFRRFYGTSPSRYLRRLRLDWVATQLIRSDEPLFLLAKRAGFSDQSHLTRQFKQQTGLAPGQYRREVRGTTS